MQVSNFLDVSIILQESSSFITSNGYNWKIRCRIDCHSLNVLYFNHITLTMAKV